MLNNAPSLPLVAVMSYPFEAFERVRPSDVYEIGLLDKGFSMLVDKIKIPRAHQVVQEALEEAIMTGRLVPGQPLPTESVLAEQFGVARHTVREGMRALEQGGLVKRDAGRRLHVVIPAYDVLASRASRALLMQRVTYRELFEVATYVEVCAIELLMSRTDPQILDRLDANYEEMEAALARGKPIVGLDIQFHSIIAAGAKNQALLMAREPISILFYPSLNKIFRHPKTEKHGPCRLVEAHKHIIDAVRSGDKAKASLWMKRHLEDFGRAYRFAGLDIDCPADGA